MSQNEGMRVEQLITEKAPQIAALCREYGVTRLRVFGSALRDDWDPVNSDIDFLADFDRSQGLNAFDQLTEFILRLESMLGARVDVVDWKAARNPYFKENAERDAKVVYAA